jgi:prepilin-type N-terminal cleavage/methylation domain-containing protein
MSARGMTLVELVVGLAIAAIVAAGVMAGAAAIARQVQRDLAAARAGADTADVLEAILADVRSDPAWVACRVARCPAYLGRSHGTALWANGHAWAVHDGGLRICWQSHCELALRGVSAMQVFVDRRDGLRVHRVEAPSRVPGVTRRVEVRLWLADGSRRSRSASVGP